MYLIGVIILIIFSILLAGYRYKLFLDYKGKVSSDVVFGYCVAAFVASVTWPLVLAIICLALPGYGIGYGIFLLGKRFSK